VNVVLFKPLKPERERERVRKDSRRLEVKRKHVEGKARGALYLRGEERASC
jgi:hypothetical protein